jgi:hypothetical protein
MPKNPSSVFMIDVCCRVEVARSPMSASAPVLNIPIAIPDSAIRAAKNTKFWPNANRKHAVANNVSPSRIVCRLPNRSASCPSVRPASAMPPIVAYWNVPAAVSERRKVLMTSGMMIPTESVVIANMANITKVSVLTTAMFRGSRTPLCAMLMLPGPRSRPVCLGRAPHRNR